MNNRKNKNQLTSLERKVIKQLRQEKSLFGKDGVFAPILKRTLEKALEAEMAAYLEGQKKEAKNKRNGKKSKTIKSSLGTFTIATPQDRKSAFEPKIIRKRETMLTDSLQDKIIGLYGLGMSYRDISNHIQEMYDVEISHTLLTQITDRIIPEVIAWQNRPLDSMYPIVWLDAMRYKVQEQGSMKHKSLYNILAINSSGKKEVLGSYLAETEGAKFWLQVLTNLKNRGVEDILIACTDNLKGFSEAILTVFPKTETQTCIVHQIRHSLR